ncbi:MAG TPA: uroporphyrinogen decarboxylase [Clostridiales bacterium]|nr:uroporphyrinogen decarboxylase [Clostridiales bacterium]
MTPYERLYTRLRGETVDRAPNLCLVMALAAKEAGSSYREMVTDYRVLCNGMLRCQEKYALDFVSAISDPMREASGFGVELVFPEEGVPYAKAPLFTDITKAVLRPVAPENAPRMLDRLQAVRYFARRCKGKIPIVGWVEGPFAELCDLAGVGELMMALMDEPEAVHAALRACFKQAEAFALAQVREGADIIGIGDAAASLIGPANYRAFALPYERDLIEQIHRAGALAKLHICGDITSILADVANTGADIVDCDWMVDLSKAAALLAGKAAVCGNFDPVAVLLQGTPGGVEQAVASCLANTPKTSLIAAGCEVPRNTPPENFLAVARALAACGQ